MKLKALAISVTAILAISACASLGDKKVTADTQYTNFPVTVKSYTGDASNSVSYKGQVARHLLHNSLKSLSAKGNGSNAETLKAQMLAYYSGKDAGRAILSPKSSAQFPIKQKTIDDLSKGKNLSGKTYSGTIPGWPGNLTGPEVVEFMIDKAAHSEKGFDPLTGYDYKQLISKFLMGAVFYNQAVDNYLDEKLAADTKPNSKAYKDGAAYTGKEHVWDEAFGYFGVPAHTMGLSAKEAYSIAKGKPEYFTKADANGDGIVDLYTEMTYAHGYYAANADLSGKTGYLKTITGAFLAGRQLLVDANGENLSDKQRTKLRGYADTIATNWELVIAEATFKYAGSVYKDLKALQTAIDNNGDAQKAFRQYAKHWGELKGFALALQTGKRNLGAVAARLNKLIGFSPVLLGNTQVSGISATGGYTQAPSESMEEYALHMLKVQDMLVKTYNLKARNNDLLSEMASLLESLGGAGAETD